MSVDGVLRRLRVVEHGEGEPKSWVDKWLEQVGES
jgi:hypothetical protein